MSSAAVMSTYFGMPFRQSYGANTQVPLQAWLAHQMAQYPPVPPAEQQQFNNGFYSDGEAGQQAFAHQEQLQYGALNQAVTVYPKVESVAAGHVPTDSVHAYPHEPQAFQGQLRQHLQFIAPQDRLQQPARIQTPPERQIDVAQSFQSEAQPPTPDKTQKINRLRKACDSCSIRKVKCDESGPPCRPCAALELPCTFKRPSRRRGPPNRHAEALKRRRREDDGDSPHQSGHSSPSSPTSATHALATQPEPANTQLSAESICPRNTVAQLVDDFFLYLHPLCPFPHEPSFREALERQEDVTNNTFLALLASMMGALAALHPRAVRSRLSSLRQEGRSWTHRSLIKQCQKVCAMARGVGYLQSDSLSVYDAATSYFLALTALRTSRQLQARLYFGECLTITRALGLHRAKESVQAQLHGQGFEAGAQTESNVSASGNTDMITLEVGRRIFWTMFATVRSLAQLDTAFGDLLILPPTPSEAYPPLPTEVDDACIFPDHIDPQPPDHSSLMTNFNANVRIHTSSDSLTKMEMAWGVDVIVDWTRQRKVLHDTLRRCKAAINAIPPDASVQSGYGFAQLDDSSHSAMSFASETARHPTNNSILDQRRQTQQQVQRAGANASNLSTRTYIVQKYSNLSEANARSTPHAGRSKSNSPNKGITAAGLDGLMPSQPFLPLDNQHDIVDEEMRRQRESVVRDLLDVLGGMNDSNFGLDIGSLSTRLRPLINSLLAEPDHRKGQLAHRAQPYLVEFHDILARLEDIGTADGASDLVEIDAAAEHKIWVEMHNLQQRLLSDVELLGVP